MTVLGIDGAPVKRKIRKGKFVVIQSMIVVRVGADKNAVRRFPKGAVIELTDEFCDVREMIRLKAITKFIPGKFTYQGTTAAMARLASGADDDPVPAPVQAVNPIVPDDAMAAEIAQETAMLEQNVTNSKREAADRAEAAAAELDEDEDDADPGDDEDDEEIEDDE